MARPCTICRDPRVSQIDAALGRRAYRTVAGDFRASESAVYRHSKHIHARVSRTRESKGIDAVGPGDFDLMNRKSPSNDFAQEGDPTNFRLDWHLVNHLLAMQRCTAQIIERATAEGQSNLALRAIRESRETIELLSKLGTPRGGSNPIDSGGLSLADQIRVLTDQTRVNLLALPATQRRKLLRGIPAEIAKALNDRAG